MSAYEDRLRDEKKATLSQRVTASIVDDIWCMSLIAADAQEFVDYLMTVTNDEAVEEFFNKCHAQNGKFCGGSSGTGRGPGTRIPAPIDYTKQQIKEKAKITGQRYDSDAMSKVTTSPIRRQYGGDIANPSGYGTVKIRRLQKAKLSAFKTEELQGLKTRLHASQRQYNRMNTVGLVQAAGAVAVGVLVNPVMGGVMGTQAAYAIGVSRWKTKRIPKQITRIERELSKRKGSKSKTKTKLTDALAIDDSIELALDDDASLPTLAQEIAAAKKEIESGNLPKTTTKISKDDVKELESLLSDVEQDDDLTSEQIKGVKDFLAECKKSVK